MNEEAYAAEEVLQQFIAQYPDLIPGDQITPEAPRNWMLVSREMPVPGNEYETGRWSLDHLFLDQDGVPTFVECKRATDTRARREVVAQMLDYAANGTYYWSIDKVRQAATETASRQDSDLDTVIMRLIGSDGPEDIEEFWMNVEKNLQRGRVRLIFAADHAPRELRRLVEFLNEQMSDVEVLIVEIRQYRDNAGQTALIPRVIGMTETARDKKKPGRRGKTNLTEFLENCLPETLDFFSFVVEQARDRGHEIYWGQTGFSVRVNFPASGVKASVAYGFPTQTFQLLFHPRADLEIPEEALMELKDLLWDTGVFTRSSPYRLTAELTNANTAQLKEVYLKQLDKFEEYGEKY